MQYSPKLKKAMSEIDAILNKYDIGALVVIHTPGFAEFSLKVNPSYSCASYEKIGTENAIRIKAKASEVGGAEKRNQLLTDTANMLNAFAEVGGNLILGVMEISKMVDEKIGADHFGDGFTDHTTQNN